MKSSAEQFFEILGETSASPGARRGLAGRNSENFGEIRRVRQPGGASVVEILRIWVRFVESVSLAGPHWAKL